MKKLLYTGMAALTALTITACKPNTTPPKDSNYQTIMLGEAHLTYRDDNDFARGMLKDLKDRGFEYFAVELKRDHKNDLPEKLERIVDRHDNIFKFKMTFSNLSKEEQELLTLEFMDQMVNYAHGNIKRKEMKKLWKDLETYNARGWFDLIDEARELEMKVVCYDGSRDQGWNSREKESFQNLKDLIFDKDPNAKVVVYCGSLHLPEKPTKNPAKRQETNEELRTEGEMTSLGHYLSLYTQGKNVTLDLSDVTDPNYIDYHVDLKGWKNSNALQKKLMKKLTLNAIDKELKE